MKYFKKLKQYTNTTKTLVFSQETLKGYSYDQYLIVTPHPTKTGVILNNYNYSNTTRKHKDKIMRLCEELGIEIVDRIEAPHGLNNLDTAIVYLENKIKNKIEYSKKSRIRETTRERLLKECIQLKMNIKTLKLLKS